jgi:hypothetical protein
VSVGYSFTHPKNVKPSREDALKVLLEWMQIALAVAGFFLLGFLLLISGIAIYLWLGEPARLAAYRTVYTQVLPGKIKVLRVTHTMITPQPPQLSLGETSVRLKNPLPEAYLSGETTDGEFWARTNMVLIKPPLEAYLSGAATNAAFWANGEAFKSGGQAGWELVGGAWRLWLLGAGSLTCGLLLRRYSSAQRTSSGFIVNIPRSGAAPNGDPVPVSGKSGTTEGPPSGS